MNLYSDYDLLEDSLKILSGRSDVGKHTSAIEIKAHVEAAARELSLERFANFESNLYQRIFEFVHSDQLGEKQGGILAIRELINCTSASAEAKVIQFANTLATALKVNTDFFLIELVADAFGHMARYSLVSHIDYVEVELNIALEWLRGSIPHRRFAACAVLQQLAQNAPTIFFASKKEFFDLIWDPLWDNKEKIRLAAGKALSACLAVLSQRTYHLQWYCGIYDKIHEGLRKGSAESVHGSLLVVSETLKNTGEFMVPRFKEICMAIMALKDHRSKVVRSTIVELLSSLAQFCPDSFARSFLDESVDMLVKNCKIPELKPLALLSIGRLCRAVGPQLVNRVDELVGLVKEALVVGGKKNRAEVAPEALQCISDMVQGMGSPLHDIVISLLDPMLQTGLTAELMNTLTIIGSFVPHQKLIVQQRLLDEATKVLGNGPKTVLSEPAYMYSWSHKGTRNTNTSTSGKLRIASNCKDVSEIITKTIASPERTKKPKKSTFSFFRSSSTIVEKEPVSAFNSDSHTIHVPQNPELILLSLQILGAMLPPSNNLLGLVEHSVLPYIYADDTKVRKQAAKTCTLMLASSRKPLSTRGPTSIATEIILSKILELSVTDPVTHVRLALLHCLQSFFDKFLCREHHVQTLLLLLSDENFEIKLTALKILARLSTSNPATVLPPLRLLLMRLIAEINNSSDSRLQEEASLLISNFIRCTSLQFIIKPFVSTLLKSLPLHSDVRLTTASLEAICELCIVMREEILPFANQLLPIIIDNMHDNTSVRKQEISVKTLGQLVSATGLAIKPYFQYPQLLPWSLDLLNSNSTSKSSRTSLRLEVLRTLGLLGALEPLKYSLIVGHLHNAEKKKSETINNMELLTDGENKQETNLTRSDSNVYGSNIYESNVYESDYEESHYDNPDDPAYLVMYSQSVMWSMSEPKVVESERKLPSNNEYYSNASITALMKILRDPYLAVHHSSVTQSIMLIFKSLGMLRCVPLLDEIVPFLLQFVRKCGHGLRESILKQLSQLITIIQYHIAPFLPTIFEIIKDYWNEHLEHILCIIQEIFHASTDGFDPYIKVVLPLLLSSLVVPKNFTTVTLSDNILLKPLEQTLACYNALRSTLQPHIHIIVPALCKLLTQLQEFGTDSSVPIQILSIRTLRKICTGSKGSLVEQSHMVVSRVVHSLTRTINAALAIGVTFHSSLYSNCIHALCELGIQIGPRFITFDSLILRTIEGKGLDTLVYRQLSSDLHNGLIPEYGFGDLELFESDNGNDSNRNILGGGNFNSGSSSESDLVGVSNSNVWLNKNEQVNSNGNLSNSNDNFVFNQLNLARAWDVSQRSTASDWNEWLRRLNIDLIRESPSPALRAASAISQAYAPLARDLFHPAFVSCWTELNESYRDNLVKALQTAFQSVTIPPEILQSLLNLAEFMEHDVEALPISLSILAELAQKGHAYAKALHYRELEFQTGPAACFESLININKKLDQYDAAVGVLKVVANMQLKHPELTESYTVQEGWLAKLGNWPEALDKYEQRLKENPKDFLAITGKLKCLDALGRWEEAIKICMDSLDLTRLDSIVKGDSTHTKISILGARAAWSLNNW
jgi:FKBP12-rapamycin complex-associated protein